MNNPVNTVTLTMIVKNEAANLEACLKSAYGKVDEIIVVDTGSTDHTLQIAHRYTDKIYRYPWHNDFSAARNFALDLAGGAWILYLDADEELVTGPDGIQQQLERDQSAEAYLIPLNNPIEDNTEEYNRFLVLRLFRNNGRYRFRGKIHEQVIVENPEKVGTAEGIMIQHKMLSPKESNRKRGRNLALLKKAHTEDPGNPFIQYYLGVEWLMLGKPGKSLPFLQKAYQNLTDFHLIFRSPALRYLIICLQALGQLDEAICLCLEADLKYPAFTDIHYLGGILFKEKQEYELAIKWFNQAVNDGTPPALFSHMNGTSSFLAFFQLGHCQEILGRRDSAREYYELALVVQPGYIHPVYNLFLILLAQHSPNFVLDYLRSKSYWINTDLRLAVARLFYTAGYPYLACSCLEEKDLTGYNSDEIHFYQGKYYIYSGQIPAGLEHLNHITRESSYYPEAEIHRVIGLLLLNRLPEARGITLQLWKNPTTRQVALILSNLIYHRERVDADRPAITREITQIKAARDILNRLNNYLPKFSLPIDSVSSHLTDKQRDTFYSQLYENLEVMFKNTPSGNLALLSFYRDKASAIKDFYVYKFGPGGLPG